MLLRKYKEEMKEEEKKKEEEEEVSLEGELLRGPAAKVGGLVGQRCAWVLTGTDSGPLCTCQCLGKDLLQRALR